MCFNKPFVYTKLQLDQSMHSHFLAKYTKCAKWRNYFWILIACVLGLANEICFKFGMLICLVWEHLSSKFGWIWVRYLRVTEVWKLCSFSSCQYPHGVARRLLGLQDTLPCVLIMDTSISNDNWYNRSTWHHLYVVIVATLITEVHFEHF